MELCPGPGPRQLNQLELLANDHQKYISRLELTVESSHKAASQSSQIAVFHARTARVFLLGCPSSQNAANSENMDSMLCGARRDNGSHSGQSHTDELGTSGILRGVSRRPIYVNTKFNDGFRIVAVMLPPSLALSVFSMAAITLLLGELRFRHSLLVTDRRR